MAVCSGDVYSRVELTISCSNLSLQDSDLFFKSDPLVVVSMKRTTSSGEIKYDECGRTEWQRNTLNPSFTTTIVLRYFFETTQELKFSVYDLDTNTSTALLQDENDLVGVVECTLAELLISSPMTRELCGGRSEKLKEMHGTITVKAEDISESVFEAEVQFAAENLDKKDFLGKSDPFLEICKLNPGNTFSPVYSTEVVKKTLHPVWRPLIINSNVLCKNEVEQPIRVNCYDWDSEDSKDLIGYFDTTFAELQSGESLTWECINEEKKHKKKKYKNSGVVKVLNVKAKQLYRFLDYIMGGCQLNLVVGIDFTTSNKHDSLHNVDSEGLNQYINTVVAVGEVCQSYNEDKMIPAFGFGGQVYFKTSDDFPLDRKTFKPHCSGIDGVLKAYHSAVHSVTLGGPKTNIVPIVNHVASLAAEAKKKTNNQQYFILLLIMPSDVSSSWEAGKAIIAASHLPLSVIMVGVGTASFIFMNPFQKKRLEVDDKVADRDMVQFVSYRKFRDAQSLAAAVLGKIPEQLTEYMNKYNIRPLKV